MKNIITLLAILYFVSASCDKSTQFMVNGNCISKVHCLGLSGPNFYLTPRNVYSNFGDSTLDIQYSMQLQSENIWQISAILNDEYSIFSSGCVKWGIFQVKNHYRIEMQRINVGDWPKATYTNSTGSRVYKISFLISPNDAMKRKCWKAQQGRSVEWQCYFEVYFEVAELHYLSTFIRVTVSDGPIKGVVERIGEAAPIVQYVHSQDECNRSMQKFEFCEDGSCTVTSLTPFGRMYPNRKFIVKHSLVGIGQNQIEDVGFFLKNDDNQFHFPIEKIYELTKEPTYTVYEIQAPLATSTVELFYEAFINGIRMISSVPQCLPKSQQEKEPEVVYVTESGERQLKFEQSIQTIEPREHFLTRKVGQDPNNAQFKMIQETPPCDLDTHFIYMNVCMDKSCIFDKLQRVSFEALDGYTADPQMLKGKIAYNVEFFDIQEIGEIYKIQIRYGDIKEDQIVSDGEKCLSWRIFQTANTFEIDSTRLNLVGHVMENNIPTWPQAVYSYNDEAQAAEITFFVTSEDLVNHNCELDVDNIWNCYFEFCFIMQKITQISFYFSVQITPASQVDHRVISYLIQ